MPSIPPGFGGSSAVSAATNASSGTIARAGLNRISNATVDMGLSIIPLPQAKPAEWVG